MSGEDSLQQMPNNLVSCVSVCLCVCVCVYCEEGTTEGDTVSTLAPWEGRDVNLRDCEEGTSPLYLCFCFSIACVNVSVLA